MGKRRRARELAIQVLFHMEYNDGAPEEAFELVCENFDAPEWVKAFSKDLVKGVVEHKEEVDRRIRKASKNWRLERMSRVDRSVLRLATYEIIFREDIPPKVSIDEAVELGKKFGAEDSAAFINGILDNIYNTWASEERVDKTLRTGPKNSLSTQGYKEPIS
ncbi:MAG: transcription antitermination factor NusB [Deltaproteobacteria bacterium]|nr:MAG: transcription antitermination factor NusB [Deltaproteobacteria bacterium]RLB74136.1 MAG: transcription antitermination factor NusB [Deltaproteobacteria bacterium]